MNLEGTISCPDCSSDSNQICDTCGNGWPRKNGIVSFIDEDDSHPDLEVHEVEKIADVFEDKSAEEALDFVVETYGRNIFDEIANVRTETWRMLVQDELNGKCLDLFPTFGKSSRMLGEVCDEVYAVDRCLNQLRVLENLEESNHVVPIHTDLSHLPFAEKSFDIVIVSSIHRNRVQDVIQIVNRYLKTGGTLIVRLDGWTKLSGITRLFGLEADTTAIECTPSAILKSNAVSIERTFQSSDFTDIDIFSTISTSNDRKVWSFNVNRNEIVQWLLQSDQRANLPRRLRIARSAGKIINTSGLLKNFYPEYIIACRKNSGAESPNRSDELLMTGMNRTVLVSVDETGIQRIRKVPNSHSFEHINQNAIDNISQLQSTGISDSLPSGESRPTKFGTEWREEPVDGIPLNDSIDRDIEGFRTCLTIGLDWLCRLARETNNEEIKLTNETIEEDLSHPEVRPVDTIDEGVSLPMVKTAIHGDFSLPNIFVEDGEVTTVIDWEFSRLNQYPVTDAGFFLLQTAEYLFEDFENGFDEVFLNDTQFRETCKEHVDSYCQRVGLPTESFITYLPYSYFRRARIDRENHHTLDIDWAARADYIRQNQATLENVFL